MKVNNVDSSLYSASKIFRDNCNEVIKLTVLNKALLKDITYLLGKKYEGIIEINLYGNTFRMWVKHDCRLTSRDIVDIEDLCGCTLKKYEGNYYWFDFEIDGEYKDYYNCGRNITDFLEEYKAIKQIIYDD